MFIEYECLLFMFIGPRHYIILCKTFRKCKSSKLHIIDQIVKFFSVLQRMLGSALLILLLYNEKQSIFDTELSNLFN